MRKKFIKLRQTESTNDYLRANANQWNEPLVVVSTDYQTAGRGQKGNSWEAEAGKNLLFSILLHPSHLEAREQFCISEAIAVSILQALKTRVNGVQIKWPNDIYIGMKKVCGILVENSLQGATIDSCIIGCGVNVNQKEFKSDAPNPVSLLQATGKEGCSDTILLEIIHHFDRFYSLTFEPAGRKALHALYTSNLLGWNAPLKYEDSNGTFTAQIVNIDPNGTLSLKRTDDTISQYAFKEVKLIID